MIIKDFDLSEHGVSCNGLAFVYHGRNCYGDWMNPPWSSRTICNRVTNWATGKRAEREIAHLRANGWNCELRYDAAHGCRYAIAIWPNTIANQNQARRVVIAALDGISDMRQYMLDSGIPLSEILESKP